MMRGPLSGQGQLDWLLEAFLLQTPGVAARDCDMGMIGYEMTMLAAQVGHALTPVARLAPEWPPT
jgi:hypothetical protein